MSAPGSSQAISAGVVAAVVGFAGAFTVVLAGLRGAGASPDQAASGLLALLVTMGVAGVYLALRTRMPIAVAWSTPGAALLATAGVPEGGFSAAVGAFVLCGVLLVLAGLWRPLGRLIDRIPTPVASAMLAGVLLPLCLSPMRALSEVPEMAGPVVAVWVVLFRFARRWAVPAALVVAVGALVIDGVDLGPSADLSPGLAFTAPTFELGALVGLGIPLFVVTMASQNVTGMAVLASFGYRPPLRPVLATTGTATLVGAPFGGHAVNLAAITAALVAGPDAHPDPARRWPAAVAGAATYLVLGLGAAAATAFISAAPPVLVEAVAGLALLGALGGAVTAAVADPDMREAAIVTFVVSASGTVLMGVSASFWGLLAGLGYLALQRFRPPRGPAPSPASARP